MSTPQLSPSAPGRPLLREAAPLCAAWAVSGLIHLGLSLVMPGISFGDLLTPGWFNAGRICWELSGLAALILLLAAARAALVRLERRFPSRGVRRLGLGLRGLGVFACLLVLGASWASYFALGQFADFQSLEFAWVNGTMFLGYVRSMHPALLVALPLASLAGAAAVVLGLPALVDRIPVPARERSTRVLLAIVAVCLLLLAGVELFHGGATEGVYDPLLRRTSSWSTLYEFRRESTSGPVTRFAFSALRALTPRTDAVEVRRDSVLVERRRQVPMKDYVATVDRGAFRPRNVVLVIVDSMRPDRLESGGAKRPVMRRVDALAREGRVFADARTEASHTDYATLCPLNSQYPLRSPTIHRYPANPDYPRVLIYDLLKALGYRTALYSSQDENWGRMLNFMSTGGLDVIDHGNELRSKNMSFNFRDDDKTVDAAIRWVEQDAATPFFLYVNLQSAHFPYAVPKGWTRRFGKKRDFHMTLGNYPAERVDDVRNLYDDALDFIDAQIGKLVDALKQQNRWSETIFVLVADHGQAFLEHGFGGHASAIYDEVMKVPMVFHGPGVPIGVDLRPAELIDVPVSLCRLLGLPPHPSFQGSDLFAAGPPRERSRFMLVHTPLATQYGVERGKWKVILDERMRLPLLYDLEADPGERRDLSREQPAILRELERQVLEWKALQLEYYRNPTRLKEEYPPVLRDGTP